MIGASGPRPKGTTRPSPQTLLTHEARNPIERATTAPGTQLHGHARAAIAAGMTMGMDAIDLINKNFIFLCPHRGEAAVLGRVIA